MKKRIAAVLMTATIAGSGLVTMSGAQAAGCVNKNEYRRIKHNRSKTRVQRIFDTAGKQTYQFNVGGSRYQSREYRSCYGRWGFVSIDYKDGKVDGKFAYWG